MDIWLIILIVFLKRIKLKEKERLKEHIFENRSQEWSELQSYDFDSDIRRKIHRDS